jgi:Arc/MetJ-type ribon-helix-helix transcriptional regulator
MIPARYKSMSHFIREGIDPLLEREDGFPRPVRARRTRRSFR